jgi:hypothetical protein
MEQSYVVRKIKKRNIADVETVSDEPFEWFPELEKLFENFNIKNLKIEIDDNETIFEIDKV